MICIKKIQMIFDMMFGICTLQIAVKTKRLNHKYITVTQFSRDILSNSANSRRVKKHITLVIGCVKFIFLTFNFYSDQVHHMK